MNLVHIYLHRSESYVQLYLLKSCLHYVYYRKRAVDLPTGPWRWLLAIVAIPTQDVVCGTA